MSRTSPQSSVHAVRKLAVLVVLAAVLAPSLLAREAGVRGSASLQAAVAASDPALLLRVAQLRNAEPETAVREVYQRYERTARQSGHDLDLRLSGFETVGVGDFSRFHWLDLLTPPTGMHVVQVRRYQEAPWLDGERVFYDLSWQQHTAETEEATFRILDELRGATMLEVVLDLGWAARMDAFPLAVTTYRVRVRLAGRDRTYRAAAFWFVGAGGGSFELQVQDHVVPGVASAMVETAEVVTREAWRGIGAPDQGPERRALDASTTGSCYANNHRINHQSLSNANGQGHDAGYHSGVLGMRADCISDTACNLQCLPAIIHQGCEESSNANVYGTCHHYPQYDTMVSGGAASGDEATCGAALACGVKECCGFFCGPGGGVNLSFSGSGGGLTATASGSGSAPVYNLSLNDMIECPAPTPNTSPCQSSLTSSSTAGRITAPIFIPCDDTGGGGDGGPDEPNPSDGGTQGDGTPILLDLGGSGFELTDLAGGVAFDLDADGTPELISWTAAGSDDAFLVLDRDGDGAIDDGSELFGDATPQPPSAEPHGYRALAVFDAPDAGGDGDGRITAADAVFAELELWRDADHDGVADAGERQSLADAGVVALELDYVESRRRDRHGNLVRYTSRFETEAARGRSLKVAADVIFLQAQP